MTTFTDFVPSPVVPFRFQPMLDGELYQVTVTWNLFGQRWYINVVSLDGTRIVSTPLIPSPDPIKTASVVWDSVLGVVRISTVDPHGIEVGTVASLTLRNILPDSLNGVVLCRASGPYDLTYPQIVDPGAAVLQGAIGPDFNLVEGYFATSTLVFRESSRQFEVSP